MSTPGGGHTHWYFDPDHHGQLTPAGPVARRPRLAWAMLIVLTVTAIVSSIDRGRLLDTWDAPIQEWVERNRHAVLDEFFLAVSRLGSNIVIFPFAAVMALLAWFRCRPLSMAIAVAVAIRPLFEWVLKDVVGRPRPDLDRMVPGMGYSHPSGHVLATTTLYLLLPAVVALYFGRNRLWQASWLFVAVLAPMMAVTRVYLGVHWATDVTAGLLWGVVYLSIVGMVFDRHHLGYCGQPATTSTPRTAGDELAPDSILADELAQA